MISLYSPTNASDEMEITTFIWLIPKHNVLVIGGDINVHIDKDRNNKFCLNNATNKNGNFLSLSVFGLLFSSLVLFPQRFRRYVLRPSSDN